MAARDARYNNRMGEKPGLSWNWRMWLATHIWVLSVPLFGGSVVWLVDVVWLAGL